MRFSKDFIIEEIKARFNRGCPNGFLLGWDRDRFLKEVTDLSAPLRVINNTDFNYSYCNSYEIIISSNSNEPELSVILKLSFILDIYSLYCVEYVSGRRIGRVVKIASSGVVFYLTDKLEVFFTSIGFDRISNDFGGIEVKGVCLELAEAATVEKCLFDDF